MEREFSQTMLRLRKDKGLSQRQAAADLRISQALLSHYENGAREPGLSFVCRACKYYGVSADYLLGLSDRPGPAGAAELSELLGQLKTLSGRVENALEELGK